MQKLEEDSVDYYGVEEKTEFSNTPPLQFIPNFKKIKE
jgi:hypothetical protein